MQPSAPATPIPLSPMLPQALRPWAQHLEPALWRLLVPDGLSAALEQVRRSGGGSQFARRLLDALDIRFHVDGCGGTGIPAHGPAVIVANHPFGLVEGLILADMLESVRPDWKLIVNFVLANVAELRAHVIPVNPFDGKDANRENQAPLREAMRLLSAGGALGVFPAGEVAHLDIGQHSITDPPWKTTAARLALRSECPVVPVFFEGANSLPFHLAGILHPGFRTMGLAHEFQKLRGKTIRVCIGKPIPHSLLKSHRGECATAYLRSRTLFLANRSQANPPQSTHLARVRAWAIDTPGAQRPLSEEVAALPAESELAASPDFAVYIATAGAIPGMLAEIGRCRERAFRAAGEGTGKESDLDRFDAHYQHLFLWSKTDQRLAGAYRLAVTTDVLPKFGVDGLYTSTLFRFERQFFERLGPAVELGRSFVLPEYQKEYASLLLLWKGIMRFVMRRPEAPVLFGAVSISRAYCDASRGLIARYLSDRASHELASLVAPRTKHRGPLRGNPEVKQLSVLAADIEDLSLCIADIEGDSKGVPVLIRQYLRMGGRLLGFNIDPRFSLALDALILADLRTAPPAMLQRCMGRGEADAFLAGQQAAPRNLTAVAGRR